MAFEGFRNEEKRIELVWALNLLPPFLGIGTIYAIGPNALILVIIALLFLCSQNFSVSAMFTDYVFLSVFGTLGGLFHNMYLNMEKSDSESDSDALDSLPDQVLEGYALDSFERKLHVAEMLLQQKNPKVKTVDNIESDTRLVLDSRALSSSLSEAVLNTSSDNAATQALSSLFSEEDLESIELDEVSETWSVEPKLEVESASVAPEVVEADTGLELEVSVHETPARESESISISESTSEPDSQPLSQASEIPGLFKDAGGLEENLSGSTESNSSKDSKQPSPEEKVEIEKVMSKLTEATGEFQPVPVPMDSLTGLEGYSFSTDFEDFKFESPSSFDTEFKPTFESTLGGSSSKEPANSSCGDCGSDVNPNFSFCLTCGKVL